MFICPVCEHQQPMPGECEVCGTLLAGRRSLNVQVPRLAELEVTRYPMGAVSTVELPEIERTAVGGVGTAVPIEDMPELDRGRASIGEIRTETLGDVETGRFDEARSAPAPSGTVSCRYCRHVQAAGMLCERCGMRLPRYVAALPEEPSRVLHACGVLTRPGRACASCGVYVPVPSE